MSIGRWSVTRFLEFIPLIGVFGLPGLYGALHDAVIDLDATFFVKSTSTSYQRSKMEGSFLEDVEL